MMRTLSGLHRHVDRFYADFEQWSRVHGHGVLYRGLSQARKCQGAPAENSLKLFGVEFVQPYGLISSNYVP